ncbi:hypothetical protein RJ641_006321 [Dillenia turbinata]|uniref:Uncharacterized protein n=1 Tax=Dillenia turbinata TaxID=194707 RepID=A0AAN8V564_9MAGN
MLVSALVAFCCLRQLRDLFNTTVLHDTIAQILDVFMKSGGPQHWLHQFMVETRAVLSRTLWTLVKLKDRQRWWCSWGCVANRTKELENSNEFEHIVEQSVKKVIDSLVEDLKVQAGVGDLSAGVPLAKLLPRVALMSPRLLEKPNNNKFIQMIRNMQEVEVFFTLIYSDMQS